MCQEAWAKDTQVVATHKQIPQKVARSIARDGAAHGGFPEYPPKHGVRVPLLSPCGALLVVENDPECKDADESALDERHHVDVPVDLRALVEIRVYVWQEEAREKGRDEQKYRMIRAKGQEDIVDMDREGREIKGLGE